PFGVIVWHLDDPADDHSLRLLFANRAASALVGIELGPCIGKRMMDVFPSVTAERVRLYAEVCRDRTERDFGQIAYADSRVAPGAFSVTAIPVLERGVAALIENVSALRRAESEARRYSGFLDLILEQLPAMVF